MPKCEIIAILDKSGSMAPLANDVIGGWNAFLDSQKDAPYETAVTLTLFDHVYRIVHSGVPLSDVPPLTPATYRAEGMTALYDAIGRTLVDARDRIAAIPEAERPERVMVAIYTDGEENASTDYTHVTLQGVIEDLKTKHAWEFLFLGAGIDVARETRKFGYRGQSVGTGRTSAGIQQGFQGIREAYTTYCMTGTMTVSTPEVPKHRRT